MTLQKSSESKSHNTERKHPKESVMLVISGRSRRTRDRKLINIINM